MMNSEIRFRRDEPRLAGVGGLMLDLKLGARMLRKYPGLTVVGGLAMAFAIACGAVVFTMISMFLNPSLPLPGGDRIVVLRNWDVRAAQSDARVRYDYDIWRRTLRSVTDIGAFHDVTRNLVSSDGEARPVQVAEMTANGFRVASGQPALGRALVPSDELADAQPVVVLGHDLWRTRFAGDSAIVGRTVQLGNSFPTVVGVMPDDFAFPVSHELWMPLRLGAGDEPRTGIPITVFGRLAPGVMLDEAQVELTTIGQRIAAEHPQSHRDLQPQVKPYAELFFDANFSDRTFLFAINFFVVMLLVLVCSNVALLMFARAATRETELVVRGALGASRRRIVVQLFAEALVLGAVAVTIGLGVAAFALGRWGSGFLETNLGRLPFWYEFHLPPATVAYAIALTVLGAAVAGILPGLKITRGLGSRLREGTSGGGVKFGGIWTAVIIAQVAVTVAFPAIVFVEQRELVRIQSYDVGFAAGEYLGAHFEADAIPNGDTTMAARIARDARFAASLEEVRRRVAADPGVEGVTFVSELPRMFHSEYAMELDTASGAPAPAAMTPAQREILDEVAAAMIDPSYFDVLGAPVTAGRSFLANEVQGPAPVVIVDQAFVDQLLPGRNPIGMRIRFATRPLMDGTMPEPAPWYEIVGVAKELGIAYITHSQRTAGMYLPMNLARHDEVHMMVHTKGEPLAFAPRLRDITLSVDPTLRLSSLQRVDQVANSLLWVLQLWIRITVVMTVIALVLSLAGIYSVLSFTVAKRTREIGVRVALGASRRGLMGAIFKRPLTQVALGVLAGGMVIALFATVLRGDGDILGDGTLSLRETALLIAYAALMFAVCLLACIVPTRRALSVEPMEALRAE